MNRAVILQSWISSITTLSQLTESRPVGLNQLLQCRSDLTFIESAMIAIQPLDLIVHQLPNGSNCRFQVESKFGIGDMEHPILDHNGIPCDERLAAGEIQRDMSRRMSRRVHDLDTAAPRQHFPVTHR